jgi:hypothetical protein
MQGVRKANVTSMRRGVETSFLTMRLAEINPIDPSIETAYDITTKTAQTLPNGDQFWYTRLVASDDATPDLKQVNLAQYRSSTAPEPYRTTRREISPAFLGYDLGSTTAYYKDSQGYGWAPMANTFSNVAGARVNGRVLTHTEINGASACPTVSSTSDATLFQTAEESSNVSNLLQYRFFATLGKTYVVRLGTAEYVSSGTSGNERRMAITINGVSQGTLDARSESGGSTCTAIVKSYTVTPTDLGSGVGGITIQAGRDAGATLNPRLAFVSIQRQEF